MKMSKLMDIETAKEMIMDELYQLQEDNKKPIVKFKDIYRNNKQWSPIFFKAGKELDDRNDNIDMYARYGFHQIELTHGARS